MSNPPKQIDEKTYTGSDVPESFNEERVWDTYFELLNKGRRTKAMVRNLDKPKTLDPKLMTKHALVQTLTTNSWLTTTEISKLLEQQKYTRTSGSVRRGLARMLKFGLAESQKIHGDRYGRKQWRLTERGAQYAIEHPQKLEASSTPTTDLP